MPDPLVFPTAPATAQVPLGADQLPPLDAAGNWIGDTQSNTLLLRGIYCELRVLNIVLAEGLNVRGLLESVRKDVSVVYPDPQDQV